MLQDIPPPTFSLREACPCVLETERLTLRSPTLADVKAIAHLANDRRIAENTRRLPHPYLQEHAVEFVRGVAASRNELVFLIEQNFVPIGMTGISWSEPESPELGYWLGFEHWGQGFGTEAVRAVIDHFFEDFGHEILFAGARATSWRSAASSGAASSCTASRRSAPPPPSTASASPAASGPR
jgi:RimJ/RimL family protein N-acetyltransferase